jgi:hypothetical protein
VDARVVAAFFEALSPLALDVDTQAMATQRQQAEPRAAAHQQHLARWRYEAARCERPCRRVDPDHRLVAAARERRWEAALRARTTAEAVEAQRVQPTETVAGVLAPEVRAACLDMGRTLPDRWSTDGVSQPQRTALRRCLMDTVGVHRAPRDEVQTRLVWQGGATTPCAVPVTVGACADRQGAAAMAQQMLTLGAAGHTDDVLAAQLTQQGSRAPQRSHVVPSPVRTIRLTHGGMQQRHQSPPRRVAGSVTVPHRARRLGVPRHWLSDRLANGPIPRATDPTTGLAVCPDQPATLEHLQQLRAGTGRQVYVPAPHTNVHPQDQGEAY